MASTPILPFAVWQSGTNQNSIPANDNALRIEALNREIISQAVTAQPASPVDGDTYIIAATHTGTQWAGFTPKDIAIFKSGTWYAWAPTEGLIVNVAGSEFKYDGGVWVAVAGGGGGMTNPMTAVADLIVGGTVTAGVAAPARLAAGTALQVLRVNAAGTALEYATPAGPSSNIAWNSQTGNYTLVLADANNGVEMSVASANNLTVPPNSSVAFPVGCSILICQAGAGLSTIVAGSGVTIVKRGSSLAMGGQYALATLVKRANDTWILSGDIAP